MNNESKQKILKNYFVCFQKNIQIFLFLLFWKT